MSSYPAPTVEILRYAGVPDGQAAAPIGRLIVLLAQRYGLDPALKHVEVIPARGGLSVYITADGWRFIADRSGELDGITFADVEKGERGWRATAHVWRKGCTHPFEGRAGCGFIEKREDPEAIAMTRATRRALKNGFASFVRVESEYAPVYEDVDDTDEPPALVDVTPPRQGVPVASRVDQASAHKTVAALDPPARQAFLDAHAITEFGSVWSDEAVADALEGPFVAGGVVESPTGPDTGGRPRPAASGTAPAGDQPPLELSSEQ